METIYEIIYSAYEFLFPAIILNDEIFVFVFELIAIILTLLIAGLIIFGPILIGIKLGYRGLKKWF